MAGRRLDPVTLSVLSSALVGIAEEMGTLLVRGAYSSNIKERRDCSTALFDAEGRMVAQAEHIPVHLGAMPEAVAAVMARDPAPGLRPSPHPSPGFGAIATATAHLGVWLGRASQRPDEEGFRPSRCEGSAGAFATAPSGPNAGTLGALGRQTPS